MKKSFKVYAASHGSTSDLLNALKGRLFELENGIESSQSSNIDENLEEINASTEQQPARQFKNYEEFVDTCYPEYNVDPEDMTAEILAVEDEIRNYGEDPSMCPTFWRDDYEDPIVLLNDDEFYFVAIRGGRYGLEARLTPVWNLYENYGEVFGLPVE